jgi:hypothetical protein
MKCATQDCTSDHGFITYYRDINDGTIKWFCSRAHKKLYCEALTADKYEYA